MEHKDSKGTLKRLSEEIEVLRQRAAEEGLAFSAPSNEQLSKKLKSARTPFIFASSWSSRGTIYSTFSYSVYVHNPDPFGYNRTLFAYFFFGPANMISEVGTALLSLDTRLYRQFEEFPYMPPNSSGSVSFNYQFPSYLPKGEYLGNVFVFIRSVHDIGTYVDRACIDVTLT